MKIYIQIAVAVLLLILGYLAGVILQTQRDSRLYASFDLYRAVKLHKRLSVGSYDHALHDAESDIGSDLYNFDYKVKLVDLPQILRTGVFNQYQADWEEKALAGTVGFHRSRPDIVFPKNATGRLDAYIPRNESMRLATEYYANYNPAN